MMVYKIVKCIIYNSCVPIATSCQGRERSSKLICVVVT